MPQILQKHLNKNIMMRPDKKAQPKLNRQGSKNEKQIMNGSIMKQINLLRKQLSFIKDTKDKNTTQKVQNQKKDKSWLLKNSLNQEHQQSHNEQSLLSVALDIAAHDSHEKQIFENPVVMQKQILAGLRLQPNQKQLENKINIWITKLCRGIKKQQPQICFKNLYRIINAWRILLIELQKVNEHKVLFSAPHQLNPRQNSETVEYYQHLNRILEQELLDVKQSLVFHIDKVHLKQKQLVQMDAGCKVLIGKYQQIFQQLETSKHVYNTLRTQRQELEQKCKMYQQNIQHKQQQLLMIQQDMKQENRESEKYKNHKIELENIYESLLADYRELQNKSQNELAKMSKQLKKWMSECYKKRIQQKQYQSLQQKIIQLKKQNMLNRKVECNKDEEYLVVMDKLREQQKSNMRLSNQNYRLEIQNEKLLKSVEYCKKQMNQLNQEVSELRTIAYSNRSTNTLKICKSSQKIQAFAEIQELIRQQKQIAS